MLSPAILLAASVFLTLTAIGILVVRALTHAMDCDAAQWPDHDETDLGVSA